VLVHRKDTTKNNRVKKKMIFFEKNFWQERVEAVFGAVFPGPL
jgi:hypothetical protein